GPDGGRVRPRRRSRQLGAARGVLRRAPRLATLSAQRERGEPLLGCRAARIELLDAADLIVAETEARRAVPLAHEGEGLGARVAALAGPREVGDLGLPLMRDGRAVLGHRELHPLPAAAVAVKRTAVLHHRLEGKDLEDGADGVVLVRLVALGDL